jgi:iron complex outermembrane receptor protein
VDTLDGNRIPGVPAHLATLTVELTRGPVTVGIVQAVRSELWADDANTLRVDGWGAGVTALRVHAEFAAGGALLHPFAAIENLFDRRHIAAVTVNGFGGRVLEPAPGRHLYVGLVARFDPGRR